MSENTHACLIETMLANKMFRGRYTSKRRPGGRRQLRQLSTCHRLSNLSGGARRDRTDDLMLAKHALSQLSYGPVTRRRMLSSPPSLCELQRDSLRSSDGPPSRSWRSQRRLVGLGRLELPTSRLSSARSNQLSYKPQARGTRHIHACSQRKRRMQSHKRLAPGACSSAKKEKRRRRNPANGAHQVFRPMAP